MIRTLLLIAGLLLSNLSYGSQPDSLLYESAFERKIFQMALHHDPIDTIDLYAAINYKQPFPHERLESFTANLKSKVEDFPAGKKLKTIYKSVHEEFLVKYSEETYFNDIFINGNYNCVSASALYAYVLDELGISYLIKETPVHVYLIADPDQSAFLIETTLPGERLIEYDGKTKSNYIEYLHNNKIISDEEFKNTATDALFEKFFMNDKTISRGNLAGLQYYNKGIFLFNKNDYAGALKNFEKALILHQDGMVQYMMNISYLNQLNAEHQKKSYNPLTLAGYFNSCDSNALGTEYGKEFFQAVSSEMIINHPQAGLYKKFFTDFSAALDISDTNDIFRAYYFFIAYHDGSEFRYSDALSNLKEAYRLNPENVNTKQLIKESVSNAFVTQRNAITSIDSLEHYFEIFTFLKSDMRLIEFLEFCYAETIQNFFMYDDLKNGMAYLKRYEGFLNQYQRFESNKILITSIYRQIGYFHMRMNQYDRAEQILRKGIRLSPDAGELKAMLENVRAYRGGAYEYPELMDDNKPLKRYLLALAIAKDNLENTNLQVPSNLQQQWKAVKTIVAGTEHDLAPENRVEIILADNNKADFTDATGNNSGSWKYDNTRCILTLTLEKGTKPVTLVITELRPDKLKCVLYKGEDYANSVELIFAPQNVVLSGVK